MLNLCGIGVKIGDISANIQKAASTSDKIYLEYYTSFYEDALEDLEKHLQVSIQKVDRSFVEEELPKLLVDNPNETHCLLVIGDPLIATTHITLVDICKSKKITYNIHHGISILNYIAQTGLQLYKFGKIISIPYTTPSYLPLSPYTYFKENNSIGLHSLFLLDLDPMQNSFLDVPHALDSLFLMQQKDEQQPQLLTKDSPIIVCSQLGFTSQQIIYTTAEQALALKNLSPPLCFIIPGKLHFHEQESLELL